MYIDNKHKPCKECGKNKRLPRMSICAKCKNERDVIKFFAKKYKDKVKGVKENFKQMKYRVNNTRQKVKVRVEKKFRLWIRLKYADSKGEERCYTCGVKHYYKQTNAGHFIHNHLDFDERNYKVQCVQCNKWLSGNLSKYREHLIKDFGEDWVKQLEKDAENEEKMEVKEILELEKELDMKIKILKS